MRRSVALAVALPAAALAAVAAVVAVGAGGAGGGPTGAAGAAARAGTELVARRTLVDRAQLDGTLGYGGERPALDRLGGTLTWLPRAGSVIRPGHRIFAVDGQPVILMDGTVPAWRALSLGVSDGPDVRQLERGLAALGHDPGTVDETFTAATAAAVRAWQDALGLTVTGRVELGRVVFLPGARRVKAVDATLGSTGGGGGGSGGSPAAWDGAAPRYAYADYVPTGATTPATTPTAPRTTPTAPATTPTAPRATPTTPATTPTTPATTPTTPATPSGGQPSGSGSPSDDGGSGGGAATATKVLTTTSTARVVTADLDAADQQLAHVGTAALVTLPDGRHVRGRVVRVGTVATADDSGDGGAGGGSGDPTLPLTIRLRSPRAAGRLDAAPVSVQLTRTSRRNVLAVPIAALIGRPGGGYAVRVARPSGALAAVPVQPGLFADGYVEIQSGGVREGDRVQVPR